jgi:DnaJ-domain-containing protein 1
MTSRPYFRRTVSELEKQLEHAKDDATELAKLAHELKFRQTAKAKAIARMVEQSISQLTEPNERNSSRATSSSSAREEKPRSTEVACQGCGQNLRIPIVPGISELRCPKCHIGFRATYMKDVFSVVFNKPESESSKANNQERPMTLEEAFRVFDAKPDTPWEDIEKCRRRLLQQYHPDKVASLGPKLRKVAETEGKNINVAFQLLRKSKGM